MSLKKKYNETEPSYRCLFVDFLICAVFTLLFVVRIHVKAIGENSQRLFSNNDGLYVDLFLYCKEILLFIIALICICYFVGEKIFPDKPCRYNPVLKKSARMPLLLMGVYLLMAVISSIFSENKETVLWGVCSEYEGIIAVFSYCILFFAGYNYFGTEKAWRHYKKAFFILITVTVVMSFFEYIVMPLMELPFMKYIIASPEYRSVAESLDFSNAYRETVLMFYNSNYMGGFCTLIFPVSVYYITAAGKVFRKIICSVISAACFIVVIMSNSTAAFYVVLAEILFIMIFMIAKRFISVRNVILIFSAFAVLVGSVTAVSGSDFFSNIVKSIFNETSYDESTHSFKLDDFRLEGNSIIFSGNGSEYHITAPVESGEQLKVSGSNSTVFTADSIDSNTILVHDMNNDFEFSIILRDGIIYLDLGYKSTIDFAVTSDGVKLLVQNKQLLSSIPHSEFDDTQLCEFYSFATGRGYIWINSLPILKDCLLIGKGPGNFPFYFNQNDLVGLLNTHGTYRLIVDKPHNWYLQIAITCGIPALLAVLILFIYFVVSGFRVFFRTSPDCFKSEKDICFLMFLYTGLCGFMVIGLSNDSCITVNPFFWFSFGIAFLKIYELKKGYVNEKK
ncbi:O-antigen ligase family protein [Porcipelethomonas sp.]|uniref:O-antigen ligase family protein n=1 Tax=Porcipelethomonas sp. TaxID=2981675 RepID=UPI003EF91FBA